MQGPQNPVNCLLTLTTAVGGWKGWLHMKLLDIQCPVQREGRLSYHISGWEHITMEHITVERITMEHITMEHITVERITVERITMEHITVEIEQHAKLSEPVWVSGKALGW